MFRVPVRHMLVAVRGAVGHLLPVSVPHGWAAMGVGWTGSQALGIELLQLGCWLDRP